VKKLTSAATGVVLALSATLIAACSPNNQSNSEQVSAEKKVEKQLASGISLENMEKSVSPQNDFYRHVNGTWLKTQTIPADKSNYGSFTKLYDDAQKNLKNIIEAAAANKTAPKGSDAQKLGDFYNAYMDEALVNSKGYEPLKPLLSKISELETHDQVAALMATLRSIGVSGPLSWYVNNDAKKSDEYAVYIGQSGLGLPDRDYYFKEDEKSTENRKAYVKYMADILGMIDVIGAKDAANRVMALETALAEKMWTRVESRDANKRYNKYTTAEFQEYMGDFPWQTYASTIGLNVDSVIAQQNTYMQAFGDMFDDVSIADWQDYLRVRLVSAYADKLSKQFVDRRFEFFGTKLRGIDEQQPRWKKAVSGVNDVLGEVLGKQYVAKHFKPEAKKRMEQLVQNVIKGFEIGIKELEWMSEDTKVSALEKLSKFTPKIGYPDKWTDYSALKIKGNDLVGNYIRSSEFQTQKQLNKLGKPIDRTEWFMTPQTVNAYYNPVMNEIVFPAAILQPPFFNLDAEDAVNYGGIGAVIGHEIGHGFDDQGAKYDGNGNLRNWWTEDDKANFQVRGKLFSEQYNQFEPLPGEFVNGELTLGENIGDLGGLTIAYKAYKLSLNGKPSPVLDGYTGEQRVFLGWAQVWRRLYRDQELSTRLVTDPHSPSEYRVNGVLQNMPEFYKAFNVKPGHKLYLPEEKRVKIW
jgi:putative endopeptidase